LVRFAIVTKMAINSLVSVRSPVETGRLDPTVIAQQFQPEITFIRFLCANLDLGGELSVRAGPCGFTKVRCNRRPRAEQLFAEHLRSSIAFWSEINNLTTAEAYRFVLSRSSFEVRLIPFSKSSQAKEES
jgi:hypothetical protein